MSRDIISLKKHTSIYIVIASLLCSFAGCSNGDIDSTPEPILRIDSLALKCHNDGDTSAPKDIQAYVDALLQYLGSTHGDTTWHEYISSRAVAAFAPETAKAFPDLKTLRDTLGMILHNATSKGLELPHRNYATVVWSDRKSIVINEPYIFVALNHYLGSNHPAYSGWPQYIRASKTPQMLPYDLTEALIAEAYPYKSIVASRRTVLSRLLYEGALAYAKMQVVPQATEARALGYDDATMADIKSNETFIWKHIIEGRMLYSTDATLIDKLFEPAPQTYIISPDAPGRAIRYIGLNIVKSYLKNYPETTLAQILSPSFFGTKNSLEKAGYSPS